MDAQSHPLCMRARNIGSIHGMDTHRGRARDLITITFITTHHHRIITMHGCRPLPTLTCPATGSSSSEQQLCSAMDSLHLACMLWLTLALFGAPKVQSDVSQP